MQKTIHLKREITFNFTVKQLIFRLINVDIADFDAIINKQFKKHD